MNLPNFIVVGCAKAGTSSLYLYLRQHPQIFMSEVKEPRYFSYPEERPEYKGPGDEERFNRTTVYRWKDYIKLFDGVKGEIAVGEASPIYMFTRYTPYRIWEKIPHAKIVILIRNPAMMAFSAYLHQKREGYETLSFEDALEAESWRIAEGWAPHWQYKNICFISEQIKTYMDLFSRRQVHISLYEDFRKDNQAELKKIFDFLGVDSSFSPQRIDVNVGGIPRSRSMYSLMREERFRSIARKILPAGMRKAILKKIMRVNLKKEEPEKKIYSYLIDCYKEDILETSRLVGKDLSVWTR